MPERAYIRQRYQDTDARDRRRNDDLTDDYRRITKQYNDMQAKFRHFEIADNRRYEQASGDAVTGGCTRRTPYPPHFHPV